MTPRTRSTMTHTSLIAAALLALACAAHGQNSTTPSNATVGDRDGGIGAEQYGRRSSEDPPRSAARDSAP